MRFFRATLIPFMVFSAAILLMGCKQPSSEKSPPLAFNAAEADWARIDLYEEDSAVKGFIDMKTYRPLGDLTVDFWHKLASNEETTLTHLVLDCQEKRYRILDRLIYDGEGNLLQQTAGQPDWKNYSPDSNAEGLCLTLSPTGETVIFTRDLPIIRELLLKGISRVK